MQELWIITKQTEQGPLYPVNMTGYKTKLKNEFHFSITAYLMVPFLIKM